MWQVTGWALATWLKLTVGIAAAVGVAWLTLGTHSGWFWAITATAVAVEWWSTRQLGREWAYEARASWWWTP